MSFQLLLCPDVEYLELASSYKGIERACRSACQNAPVFMHKWKGTAAAEGSRVLLSLEFSPPGCTRFPASLRFTPLRINCEREGRLTLEGQDLLLWVHDGGISRDWPSHDRVGVVEVDDDDVVLVSHADEGIGLEGERLERDRGGLDAESGELASSERRSNEGSGDEPEAQERTRDLG
jgi:hypothetical protein